MQSIGRTCATCRAIRKVIEAGEGAGNVGIEVYHCAKNAPRPVIMPVISEEMECVTVWPDIEPTDEACEEWAARPTSQLASTR